jgi:hypothetical protein
MAPFDFLGFFSYYGPYFDNKTALYGMDLDNDGYLSIREHFDCQYDYEKNYTLGTAYLDFRDQYDIFANLYFGDANLVGDLRLLGKER